MSSVSDEEYYDSIIPLQTKLPPPLISAEHMSWDEAQREVELIAEQLKLLHDMPKLNGQKPDTYLHLTMELLRKRCIQLHWRCVQLQAKAAHGPVLIP